MHFCIFAYLHLCMLHLRMFACLLICFRAFVLLCVLRGACVCVGAVLVLIGLHRWWKGCMSLNNCVNVTVMVWCDTAKFPPCHWGAGP